jgi:hypothetical protein
LSPARFEPVEGSERSSPSLVVVEIVDVGRARVAMTRQRLDFVARNSRFAKRREGRVDDASDQVVAVRLRDDSTGCPSAASAAVEGGPARLGQLADKTQALLDRHSRGARVASPPESAR